MKKQLRKIGRFLPKKLVLYIDYGRSYKKILNLKNPQYVGEKIQWIKLNIDMTRYGKYVDKYEVRRYIGDTIGEEYLPKFYGIYENAEEINFDKLPNRFVLKLTNGSGGNIICKDKELLNKEACIKKLNKWLKEKFYLYTKEYQYKDVKSRIICEEYLEDETGSLTDYKFHCMDGKVNMIEIHRNRYTDHTENYYDINWRDFGIVGKVKKGPEIRRPENLDEMIRISERLSSKFSFVRVDLYSVNGKIYFGELTFTPANGTDPFTPLKKDLELASLINLNNYR